MDIPILLYHRIDDIDARTTLCVPPQRFQEHMAWLSENSYNVVSLSDIVSHKKGKVKLPAKSVAITFDDGYLDNYTNAFPVLKKYGFGATIFLPAKFIGGESEWDRSPSWPTAKLMDWHQIKEMSANGIAFGSHSMTHLRMSKPKFIFRLYKEIGLSKKILEDKLKKKIDFFSFPFGKYNAAVKLFVRAFGYKGACIVKGQLRDDSDPFRMKRIEINTQNSPLENFIKAVTAYDRPKFNIMQVCTHYAWGGQEIYPARLALKLKERGHNVVFVLCKGGFLDEKLKGSGLTIEFLRTRSALDLNAIFTFVRLIKKHRIDILHVHVGREYIAAIIAAKLSGKKIVLTRHLLTPLRKLTQRIVNKSDAIVAVSEVVKDTLAKDGLISRDKIKTIYIGIDTNLFRPGAEDRAQARRSFGINEDDFVIGNIGHMGCKGQESVVIALGEVIKKYPNVKCVFITEVISDKLLDALIDKCGVRNNLVLREYQEDIPRIMRMIDIFCIAPRFEAFGMALVEAMACAKPVIATNVGGIKEIVTDKFNGLLVPQNDNAALLDAIIYMIENKEEALKMGLNACKTAREKFDSENHVKIIEEFYSIIS